IATRLLDDSRYLREAVMRHAAPAFFDADPGLASRPPTGPHAWAQAFHASAHRHAASGTAGDTRDTQGLVLGGTRPLGRTLQGSAYLGLQQSRLWRRQHRHDAQVNSRHL